MAKTKIALINPPFMEGSFHHPLLLPLGLAYLAAVAEKDGHEVKVVDCPASGYDQTKLKSELSSFNPSIVGVTGTTPTIKSSILSAKTAKEILPNAKVLVGGAHATFMDKQLLSEVPEIDVVVRGEGELTLLEIANNISDLKLEDIDGITFRKNGQITKNKTRPFTQNLDQMPHPAFHLFPLDKYRIYGKTFLPVMSSRGCPFQCAFCVTSQSFGAQFRARSATNVVDEIEWLKNTHGADGITFYDDILTLNKERILSICDQMVERKIGLPWGCQTRVDQVNKDMLGRMKRACCAEVSFGVESGCQTLLDAFHKKTLVEQNVAAVKLAKKEGLFVAVSAIVSYPGDTMDMVKQTVDLLKKMEPDDAYLCIATPYPGTELRATIEAKGWKISDDWTLYDTMNPVFENPNVNSEEIAKIRKEFYANLYSTKYILRQLWKGKVKGNYYSQMMARFAIGSMIWKIKGKFKS
jgi:anaerobic magnesium-protoporphyrin IX monomethyl ester cyclase